MSLLMDALKKAEQEKKEAAKKRNLGEDTGIFLQESTTGKHRADATPGDSDTTGENPQPEQVDQGPAMPMLDLSLEPIEQRQPPAPGIAQEDEGSEPGTGFDGDEGETIQADLGDITGEGNQHKAGREGREQHGEQHDQTAELELTRSQPFAEPDPDQTFHGVDPDKAFNPELYENTLQGEPFKTDDAAKSYDETLPGVPAAQLAKDIGTQDQPTPVAAQTIFTATNTIAKPSSGFRWLLISLAVLAVGSAIVFYYYSVTPMSRDIPSPLVARGVETIVSPGSAINNVAPPPVNTAPAVPAGAETSGTSTPAAVPAETPAATTTTAPGLADNAVAGEDEPAGETGAVEEVADADAGADETGLEPVDEATLPEVIEPPSSLVKITRSRPAARPDSLILDGWAAYQAGDYNMAQSRYRQAYAEMPENRDVLLGLAAVATRLGNEREALEYYLQLLTLNPMDNVARAALLGFEYGNNTTQSISTLKSMLFEAPEQPLLYFNLGKLYASRSSWSEAQQAFFDAYRLDSSNPDYALNLAVSLDRMGQAGPALDYYRTALSLSADTPPGFNPELVRQRIATLETRN